MTPEIELMLPIQLSSVIPEVPGPKMTEGFFDMMEKTAKATLLQDGMCISVLSFLCHKDGGFRHGVVDLQEAMRSNKTKDAAAAALAPFLAQIDAFACCFVSEIWAVWSTGVSSIEAYEKMPAPAEHPDRTEALMIVRETLVSNKSVYYEIKRAQDGSPYLGEFWERSEVIQTEGRFASFLHMAGRKDVN
jgi:hypothetical protein